MVIYREDLGYLCSICVLVFVLKRVSIFHLQLLKCEFFFCKVVDGNISSGIIKSKHLSQITSLTSSYDVAWRKHDFAKYAVYKFSVPCDSHPGLKGCLKEGPKGRFSSSLAPRNVINTVP